MMIRQAVCHRRTLASWEVFRLKLKCEDDEDNKEEEGETLHHGWKSYYLFRTHLFFFFFLQPHLQHMEVPRLGVVLELQTYTTATAALDLSHICDLHHSLWQCQIHNPLNEARDWTCILMDTSQILNLLNHNRNSTVGFFKLKRLSEQVIVSGRICDHVVNVVYV